jgi:hypothetical protein
LRNSFSDEKKAIYVLIFCCRLGHRTITRDAGCKGYAPPCGIFNAALHTFRLLMQNGMWEFYLDDLYVQAYITGPTSGRLGLLAKSGLVVFSDVKIWEMA